MAKNKKSKNYENFILGGMIFLIFIGIAISEYYPKFFLTIFFTCFFGLPILSIIFFIRSITGAKVEPPTTTTTEEKYKCPECGKVVGKEDHFCGACRHKLDGKNDLIVNSNRFDPMYKLNEKQLLEAYINKELEKLKIESKNLCPNDILIKKNISYLILSIIVFVYITSIFFHFPSAVYVIGFIIVFVYTIMISRYSVKSYIVKEIKARPKEKISNILMSIKNSSVEDNYKLLRICCLVLAIGVPLLLFKDPRIMYEKTEGGYAVRYYIYGISNRKVATIPEKYNNKPVVTLRGNTFSNMKHLKKVILPDTITEIRGQAFKNCYNLEEVNMPQNLEYLGGGAFYKCRSLKSIELPNSLTYMGGEAFEYATSLVSIKLSNKLQEIRGDTFAYCSSLSAIDIPDSVTRIGGHAFYGNSNLSKVTISENSKLQEIGSSAFRLCYNLEDIIIPQSVYVNERAFKESPTTVHRYGIDDKYNEDYGYHYGYDYDYVTDSQ